MKKTILLIAFAFASCYYGFSQSLSLADSTGPLSNNATIARRGHPADDEIVAYVFVHNNTASAIDVMVKKVELNILTGTANTFCWGLCFPPNVFVSPDSKTINANSWDSIDFSGHYNPTGVIGASSLRYVFFNRANPSDSVCVNVSYEAWTLGIDNQVAKNTLSGAYPNPANNMVSFEYASNNDNTGSVVIRNIVGAIVKQSNLASTSGKVNVNTADLADGIYFYSLVVNGTSVTTKKLVVRH
jgi:hypothetical protein